MALQLHIRACSSAGRAFGSHPRGRGFESHQVHHKIHRNSDRITVDLSVASFRRACGNRRIHGAEMELAAAGFMVPLPAARQVSCATYRTALFSRQPNRRRRCVIGRTASGGYFFANLIRQRSDCCPTSSCGPPADPRRCPGYTDDAPPAYPASSAPDTPPGCPTGAADGPYR